MQEKLFFDIPFPAIFVFYALVFITYEIVVAEFKKSLFGIVVMPMSDEVSSVYHLLQRLNSEHGCREALSVSGSSTKF